MSSPRKVLFYSHDTFGLGHIRRTQKLANTIAGNGRSILIACASPKASSFASSAGIEYLNLPGFTKQVTGDYVPRSLNVPMEDFVQLRSSLLLSAVRAFNPDVLVIDKEPLGVKRELLPALEYLRGFRPDCQVVCGFRDILDENAAVQKEWFKRDTVRVLETYFDHILIYGDKKIFDFGREYGVPAEIEKKFLYTGYLHPKNDLEQEKFEVRFLESRPLVTLTLGGGGDGAEILEMILPHLESQDPGVNMVLLTGPFASPALVQRTRRLTESRPWLTSREFIPNTASLFQQSDLVVSMGGYNTLTELLAMGRYPLILPRVKPREEQLIRARMFQRLGYCDFLHPDELTAASLFARIGQLLEARPKPPPFPSQGLTAFHDWIEGL